MTAGQALRWTLLAAAAAVGLVAGCHVREDAREACVLCGATRQRTTRLMGGFEFTGAGEAAETGASRIYSGLVSSDPCRHLWGGGPATTVGHFLFIPLGAEESEEPGERPGYRHTVKALLAVSRLDEPAAGPELYQFLVPARPGDADPPEKFVDELSRCMSRFELLFGPGGVPEVVKAESFRELRPRPGRP